MEEVSEHRSISDLVRDADLIAASFSDPGQFGAIFERHFEPIHRYASRRLSPELADDITAQVFTIAFERRHRFDLTAADARPWLYGIVSNLIRSNRRAERRMLGALSRLANRVETTSGDDDEDLFDERQRGQLALALGRLGRRQREVLLLHCWAGLSHGEIAMALGIPAGTVASRLSRARQHVRAALADEIDGAEDRLSAPTSKEDQ
jgi:RNA polymerase sigma factor (sigma-70 family)